MIKIEYIVIMLSCEYIHRYVRFQLFSKVISKGCPRKGVGRQEYLETDLSPETSAYQNSTHLLQFKTSPPSAREAAMSAMKHETFLKHLESFLETSLKHSGNTLENQETSFKLL